MSALFRGTIHFVRVTFATPGQNFSVSSADMQTMLSYAQHAIVPISEWTRQYGPSTVTISPTVLEFTANLSSTSFADSDLQTWVNSIVSNNGFDANERNVIAASGAAGVIINNSGTNFNVVAGNYIGTDVTGLVALQNNGNGGVRITGRAQSNRIGTNGDNVADNLERNLVSGNNGIGIAIDGAGSDSNTIAGNWVGIDANGNAFPRGAVSSWKAEGGATAADSIDSNPGTLNGTANGPVSYVPGEVGQAFSFDGVDDYVRVNSATNLQPTTVSAEAWVKATSPGIDSYIVSKGASGTISASYALSTGTGATPGLVFSIFNGTTVVKSPDAGAVPWDGNWHHVAGTYDGTRIHLYVDGAEVGTGTATTIAIG